MITPPSQGYWGSLGAPERAAVEAKAERASFSAGEPVLRPPDRCDHVLIVVSGLTKVVARAGSTSVVLALRGPGDIIGELATVGGDPGPAIVVAISAVEALRIHRADFEEILQRHPEANRSLYRTIVGRLCEADRDRVAAAAMTGGQRLARFLLKATRRYGVTTPDGQVIDHLSQRELAACIGGSPRTIARQMSLWRRRGIISTHWRSVTVHDPDGLERVAGRNAPPP